LARGVAIDLDNSRLPTGWKPGADYIPTMDVMFSPRGTITGSEAAAGIIHFLLSDIADIEFGRPIGDQTKEGEEIIVSLFTHTGHIMTSAVDTTDIDSNGADDPFRFAEVGEA